MIPMAGDCPPMDASFRVQSGNSPMHGGHGQNVIFADGHVIFTRSRSLGQIDSDVYANRNGHMSAGIDDNDMILVPGAAILRME